MNWTLRRDTPSRVREPKPARILWVSGEAGIGESRRLAEFLTHARPLALWAEVLGAGEASVQGTGRTKHFSPGPLFPDEGISGQFAAALESKVDGGSHVSST